MNNLLQPTRASRPWILTLALIVLSLAVPGGRAADANPPDRMTYQGYVVDASGVALGNSSPKNYDIIFRVYSEQTAGTRLWSEQQTVTVDKGYFSILLGEGSAYASESRPALSTLFSASDASDRYVEMTVKGIGAAGADVTILPRLRLLTAPYAFLAKHATTATSATTATTATTALNATMINGVDPTSYITTPHLRLDSTYYLEARNSGTAALLNFDPNDYMWYDRTANMLTFNIGGAEKLRISGAGVQAGIYYVDSQFYMAMAGSNPIHVWDANDYTLFDRANSHLIHIMAGAEVMRIRPEGVNLYGKDLYFSPVTDVNHGVGVRASINGPYMYGWDGVALGYRGNVVLRCTSGNRVGINTNDPQAPLDVRGIGVGASGAANYFDWAFGNGQGTADANGLGSVVAYVEGQLAVNGAVASIGVTGWSDARAKEVLGLSSGAEDLDRLNQLRVTDFRWKDGVAYNARPQKKLIAQEVEQVFPNAVSRSTKVIPDVFATAASISLDRAAKKLSVQTSKDHGFRPGDKVDLLTDKGDLTKREVLATPSAREFVVACDVEPERVFVYGKWVEDYRSVDYDAIAMLNVSATQELHRRLVARESELNTVKGALSEARVREDRLEARVVELEKLTRSLAAMVAPAAQGASVASVAQVPAAVVPVATKPSSP